MDGRVEQVVILSIALVVVLLALGASKVPHDYSIVDASLGRVRRGRHRVPSQVHHRVVVRALALL